MAQLQKSHPSNKPGSVFVDTTCIDCGTCFHLSPSVFREEFHHSVVHEQPEDLTTWSEVKRALVSCPTNSIGISRSEPLFKEAPLELPLLITEDLFYCGFTSEDSFGATSYLLKSKLGNILIDSPRFHPLLVKELEKLGGVQYMFLTHRDDVADHQKFRDHFALQRIIHREEVSGGTRNCEIIIDENEYNLGDLRLIKVPGHTRGHLVGLYRKQYLFTGDHLFVDEGKITSSQNVSWYSWPKQIESTKKLLGEDFEWVLPGHGGWAHFGKDLAHKELKDLIERMEK